MRTELKNSTWVLAASIAFMVFGFSLQWAIGGKYGLSIGGVMILVGVLMLALSLFHILKKK